MKTRNSLPREDGYWMPGEFEAHARCWMLWPERPDNWRLDARPAQQVFADVANAISRSERVTVGASAAQLANARRLLEKDVSIVELPFDDAWMRDVGPTFVVNGVGNVAAVHWRFNSWGGLFSSWDKDQEVGAQVADLAEADRYVAPIILEGGSIHVDGQGMLITTRECLLNPNRNPGMSEADIEEILFAYFGVERVIWLENGVYLDETSGHVDNMCCFTEPGVVVLTWTDDRTDPQFDRSREAYELLMSTRDARGRRLEVHKLLQPEPLRISAEESAGLVPTDGTISRKLGERLPASYVNFYPANGSVLVPQFGDKADNAANRLLANLFPGREIIPIQAREILLGGGNIHCIVLQEPTRGSDRALEAS